MGFRVRKSFKVMPGVRMTVTPRGMSVSGGVTGARVTANTRGQVTRTIGIPGTGISNVSTLQTGSRATPSGKASEAVSPQPAPSKPGLLGPKWEKELFALLGGRADSASYHRVATAYPETARLASMFEVLQVALPNGDVERARSLLNWLHDQAFEPAAEPFLAKYSPRVVIDLPIAPGISVVAALSRESLSLMLAELEQSAGNLERATAVVEDLDPSTLAAVSLAELYAEQARWDDLISLTDELANEDEPSTYLLIQRGVALREKGYFEASRTALKEALRPRSRPAELRQVASIERGKTYLAEGKKAMARKDFERVMAENSSFDGLAELLAEAN